MATKHSDRTRTDAILLVQKLESTGHKHARKEVSEQMNIPVNTIHTWMNGKKKATSNGKLAKPRKPAAAKRKTKIVKKAAKKSGIKVKNIKVKNLEPADMRGLPKSISSRMEHIETYPIPKSWEKLVSYTDGTLEDTAAIASLARENQLLLQILRTEDLAEANNLLWQLVENKFGVTV